MNQDTIKEISLHRFGDNVAIHMDETKTYYMDASMLAMLILRLKEYEDDIVSKRYVDSNIGTRSIRK